MIVLDAFAVLAFLKGESAAPHVQGLLDDGSPAALTAVGVAEVLDHLVRVVGSDEETAALDLAQLRLLEPYPIDAQIGAGAGLLRSRHYHRRHRSVSLADCNVAAVAQAVNGQVATSDPHLLDLCHAERIEILPLPASDGSTWTVPPR